MLLVGLVSGALIGRFYLGLYRGKGKLERKHIQMLSEELNLSEEQRAKIAPSLNKIWGQPNMGSALSYC